MARFRRGRTSNYKRVMTGLASLVTLWVIFYVFESIIDTVDHNLWSCTSGFTLNETTLGDTTTLCYNTTNTSFTETATQGVFGGAGTLLANLPEILGLIAGLILIIYVIKALRK